MSPRAGFWAIGGYKISFRKDGRWYADDEVIENPKIARLFSQHVQRDGQGGWVIDLGIDRQPVRVEDTPLVVVTVRGDRDSGFRVTTSDGQTDELAYRSLCVGPEDVLYCTVDRGSRGHLRARFLRPAYYILAASVEQIDGDPCLQVRGQHYPIRPCAAGSVGSEL
jgi:hypothetical protein